MHEVACCEQWAAGSRWWVTGHCRCAALLLYDPVSCIPLLQSGGTGTDVFCVWGGLAPPILSVSPHLRSIWEIRPWTSSRLSSLVLWASLSHFLCVLLFSSSPFLQFKLPHPPFPFSFLSPPLTPLGIPPVTSCSFLSFSRPLLLPLFLSTPPRPQVLTPRTRRLKFSTCPMSLSRMRGSIRVWRVTLSGSPFTLLG